MNPFELVDSKELSRILNTIRRYEISRYRCFAELFTIDGQQATYNYDLYSSHGYIHQKEDETTSNCTA